MNNPNVIELYIEGFPLETQKILEQLRATIKKAAPGAEEVLSYQMPAFRLNGILVYFAAYRNHIGFYPTASAIEAFKSDLSGYKHAKGSIQFPLEEPLPLKLIENIVRFRLEENQLKASVRTHLKKR